MWEGWVWVTFSFIKYERDKLSEPQAYLRPRTDEPDTGLAAQNGRLYTKDASVNWF